MRGNRNRHKTVPEQISRRDNRTTRLQIALHVFFGFPQIMDFFSEKLFWGMDWLQYYGCEQQIATAMAWPWLWLGHGHGLAMAMAQSMFLNTMFKTAQKTISDAQN